MDLTVARFKACLVHLTAVKPGNEQPKPAWNIDGRAERMREIEREKAGDSVGGRDSAESVENVSRKRAAKMEEQKYS